MSLDKVQRAPVEINVVDVSDDGAFAVALPSASPGVMQVAFECHEKNERWVMQVPREWRIDLAMKLLAADGAAVRVTTTYPKKAKAAKPHLAKKAVRR